MKIKKIKEFQLRITKKYCNSRIPHENDDNHKNHRIPMENHEKFENIRISFDNN